MYEGFLKDLLRPLNIYELERGLGGAELKALGAELDAVYAMLEEAETESCAARAGETGIGLWESILPTGFVSASLTKRREAVMALMRISSGSFTVEALNSTLYGCGIAARVEETGVRQHVRVSFPGRKGVPGDIEEIKRGVEMILPCHLEIEYLFTYAVWQDLEDGLSSWGMAEDVITDWEFAEKFGDEELMGG